MSEAGKAYSSKSNTTVPWGSSVNPAWTSGRCKQDKQHAAKMKREIWKRVIESWFSQFAAIIAPSLVMVSPTSQFLEEANGRFRVI
jgi:hypothetical protein